MIRLASHDRDRVGEWIVHHLGPLSPPWLQMQRWFGGKARPIAGSAVADVIWMGTEMPCCALVILDVRYGDAPGRGLAVERYALVASVAAQASPALIASVPGAPWLLSDAASHPGAVGDVLRTMTTGERLRGLCGGEVTCHGTVAPAASGAEITAIGQEQSNTSVRIGRRHVLKLIRRIQPGTHPQVEVGAFLTGAGFRWTPPLEASMTYRDPSGSEFVVGVLEGWIDNQGDGWRYVTTALARDAAGTVSDSLLDSLARLGAITADLHVVLASDASTAAFAPEPVGPADVSGWCADVLREETRVLDIVASDNIAWPEPARALGRATLAGRDALRRRIQDLDVAAVSGHASTIRVHGDYHLGQTLKTTDGFVLIDFEGEPARPLAERRRKQCALKDVAGMLRSLDYADAAVRLERPSAPALVEPMRRAFLDGYYARPELGAIIPARETSQTLLTMFELEKVLYEIEYELNNRPDWLPIPLGALARMMDEAP